MTGRLDEAIREVGPRVATAALAFEARWTRLTLRNHDPKLAGAFEAALADFGQAMTARSSTEIENAGSKLCRAYGVISSKLGAANVPDNAYMIGRAGKPRSLSHRARQRPSERGRRIAPRRGGRPTRSPRWSRSTSARKRSPP